MRHLVAYSRMSLKVHEYFILGADTDQLPSPCHAKSMQGCTMSGPLFSEFLRVCPVFSENQKLVQAYVISLQVRGCRSRSMNILYLVQILTNCHHHAMSSPCRVAPCPDLFFLSSYGSVMCSVKTGRWCRLASSRCVFENVAQGP